GDVLRRGWTLREARRTRLRRTRSGRPAQRRDHGPGRRAAEPGQQGRVLDGRLPAEARRHGPGERQALLREQQPRPEAGDRRHQHGAWPPPEQRPDDACRRRRTATACAGGAGGGFLMRRGYVVGWGGWDVTTPAGGQAALSISVPVATNPDGSPMVGPSLEEFVVDATTPTNRLSYAAASTDTAAATLGVRVHATDPAVAIPPSGWTYVDDRTVRLLPAGTVFQQGRLYDLTYPARDPLVAGIAFAATRDFLAFLRRASADDTGTPNPVAGRLGFVYGFGLSQPARFLRDFVHLGFNEDESGKVVFDGLLDFLAGPGGGSF